ncbi:hypothetical protein KCU78_g1923, partial [Aureobasidium melanogenum]
MPKTSPDVNGLPDSMDNVEVITATPNIDPHLAQSRAVPQSRQLSGGATPHIVQSLQHIQNRLPSGGATSDGVQTSQHAHARQGRYHATYPEYPEDDNQDFMNDSGDAAEDDALSMDGLRRVPPTTHFQLSVLDVNGTPSSTAIPFKPRRNLGQTSRVRGILESGAPDVVFICPFLHAKESTSRIPF